MTSLTGHLHFLKTRTFLQIGDKFEHIYLNASDNERLPLRNHITSHLLLLAISTSCEPCLQTLLLLPQIMSKHTNLRILLLVDSDPNSLAVIKESFENITVGIYPATSEFIFQTLKADGVPWGFTLNSEAQVLSLGPCSDLIGFEMLLRPLSCLLKDPL